MDDKRTATDVLLDIETKLNVLEKRSANIEYLLKSLLSKTNAAPQTVNVPYIPSEQVVKKVGKFEELANSYGIAVEAGSDLEEATTRTVATRGQRGPKPNNVAKSTVSQVVLNNNAPLFLANVDILDKNNQLVSQTRVDTKGRWRLALEPGDYQVHITKRYPPDSGKTQIDTMYQINIPPTDIPLELDPFLVEMG